VWDLVLVHEADARTPIETSIFNDLSQSRVGYLGEFWPGCTSRARSTQVLKKSINFHLKQSVDRVDGRGAGLDK
jgi:hypothetical protein